MKKLRNSLILISTVFAVAVSGQERFGVVLHDPVLPDEPPKRYPVELTLNEQGFPSEYRLRLRTGVCLEGSCKLLEAVLTWDALGNYTEFETAHGTPLTKNHHDPFSEKDNRKLDAILKDRRSILGTHPLNYFVIKPDPSMNGVDAVTAATPKTARDAIVEGAAYTSWVLWRWGNGEIVDQLQAKTESLLSDEYLLHCLNSSDSRFERFALMNLLGSGRMSEGQKSKVVEDADLRPSTFRPLDSSLLDALFQTLENSGRANCEPALKLLTHSSADLAEVHRRLIVLIGQNGGSSRLILSYFGKLSDPDSSVWVQIARQLQDIPGYRDLDAAFALLEKHAAAMPEVRDEVSALLGSEDRFVARRAKEFLTVR